MAYTVAALYRFTALPDAGALTGPLRQLCAELGIKGTLLLASEGINGTVAGSAEAIGRFVEALRHGPLFGNRLDALELKFSTACEMPFGRLKVRLKKEIVTLDAPEADPARQVGAYVDASDWNRIIDEPGTVVIDTRNAFEVEMGTFEGALNPGTARFSEFKDFVARSLDPEQHRRVAMFCTGGIRCEKATSYLLARGFKEVLHLKGGILRYLETVPEPESRWSGACFVFDERVALGHGLREFRELAAPGPLRNPGPFRNSGEHQGE
jgi:UPF0176 protein